MPPRYCLPASLMAPCAGGSCPLGRLAALLLAAGPVAQGLRAAPAAAERLPGEVRDRSLDIVVAHYRADLGWIQPMLQRLPTARLYLYCKGGFSKDPRCIHVENVGTEEYAYFRHLLDNWDNLADITVFSIDNMDNMAHYIPTTKNHLDFLVNKVATPAKRAAFRGFEALDFMPVTKHFHINDYHSSALRGDDLTHKRLCPASLQPFGPWYKRFINASDSNFTHLDCAASSFHGIFAVSRERIHRVKKSVFQELVKEVERCRGVNHFVAGHYLERSWSALFTERCHGAEAWANLRKRYPSGGPIPPAPK
mmetsp:Transcript_82009/g.198806  ORF Transcript_82009/g.198806 Transcript_82009/m.198806 type:complete len:309 (-) Transcript_82009:187-1113(-)